MTNKLELTDNELVLIVVSLDLSIKAHDAHVEKYGEDKLDNETREGIKGMRKLSDKLAREYF